MRLISIILVSVFSFLGLLVPMPAFPRVALQAALCVPDEQTLCLLENRVRVQVSWLNHHDGGTAGVGYAVPLTGETGAFWFFRPGNLEVIVKVLDGGAINGHFWVGVASLSDLEFTVSVTEVSLARTREYHNEAGNLWGVLDINAFATDLLDEGDACGGLLPPGIPFQCRPGLFCELPDGTCIEHVDGQHVDGQGICTSIPEACPEIYDPVCGCDGVTYSNDCVRQMAGVSEKHAGECGATGVVCEPELGLGCGPSQLCDRAVGVCGGPGLCVDLPVVCTEQYDPVCGCNGRTYSNDCERTAAGVSKQFDGACEPEPKLCGGIAGFACDDGFVCDYPAGMCLVADLAGLCTERPDACLAVYDPVCGCNGKTYGNDCELLLAGGVKDHDGECD